MIFGIKIEFSLKIAKVTSYNEWGFVALAITKEKRKNKTEVPSLDNV